MVYKQITTVKKGSFFSLILMKWHGVVKYLFAIFLTTHYSSQTLANRTWKVPVGVLVVSIKLSLSKYDDPFLSLFVFLSSSSRSLFLSHSLAY